MNHKLTGIIKALHSVTTSIVTSDDYNRYISAIEKGGELRTLIDIAYDLVDVPTELDHSWENQNQE